MSGEAFFDTTILVYAFAQDDPRSSIAEGILENGGLISVHVLNEFVAVARRKLKMPWEDVLDALAYIQALCAEPVAVTIETHTAALRIAQRYGFQIYDSLVVAAAIDADCSTLYSEDMQHGQVIGKLAIRNPFGNKRPKAF